MSKQFQEFKQEQEENHQHPHTEHLTTEATENSVFIFKLRAISLNILLNKN